MAKGNYPWYTISSEGGRSPQVIHLEGVTIISDTRTKTCTILDISQGVDVLAVMYKNYARLARAGFSFKVAYVKGRSKGKIDQLEGILNSPVEWKSGFTKKSVLAQEVGGEGATFNF